MSSRHRPRQVSPLLAVVLTVTAGLTACTSGGTTTTTPDDPPAPAAPSPSAPSPTPSEPSRPGTPVDQEARHVRSGDVELVVSSTSAPEVATAPGAVLVTVDVGPDAPALLTTDVGTLDLHPDGTVTVRDDDGTAIAALTSPSDGADLAVVDGGVQIVADAPGRTTTTFGSQAVAGTDWGDREGGRSLAVSPAAWARGAGAAGEELVWTELVAADPDVDTATMRDQLTCHTLGAPDKETWNLEPWRPDVGLVAVLAARCNPTEDQSG
ncbi:DUF2599 domain-containing protein [Isoptericola halotolerans]|uniref:DUF2599 domain-containing protein n=1 Tax=Isoptericola halotolerans TaxID=300560 RepID=A0ABX2A7W1_9MICO|nr:hypothetical protein [Isoptericola halotolerans]